VIIDDLSSVNLGPEQNGRKATHKRLPVGDTINYIRGPHTFKVGAEAKKYIARTNGCRAHVANGTIRLSRNS